MRTIATAVVFAALATSAAQAQSGWDKVYNVSSKPSLQVETDDLSVKVQSCGGCRAVHIHVDPHDANLNDWTISEMQGGNGIHFSMKHKSSISWRGWHGRSPEITVQTPTETDLTLRAGDGSLSVAGLHGNIDAHTGDGSISADDVAGTLRFTTGDGSVQLHRAEGILTTTSGDGSLNIEGKLSQIEAKTGNGSIRAKLLPGSVLSSSSRLTSGDGSIQLQIPRDTKATLDAVTGDGSIACSFPMESTTSNNRHSVHGQLNGGGPALRVQTGDGSIAISGS